ncbi:hypothetical protein ACFLXO_08020 [Chloroflexota bacterium]
MKEICGFFKTGFVLQGSDFDAQCDNEYGDRVVIGTVCQAMP